MKRLKVLLTLLIPVLFIAQDNADAILKMRDAGLKQASDNVCKCLDKIDNFNKSKIEVNEEIKACIDKEVVPFQLIMQIEYVNQAKPDSANIVIATNEKSPEYKSYYREIENYSLQNCERLYALASSNDQVHENSISLNKKARKLYEEGNVFMGKQLYEKAIEKFKKAVELDPKFAWAWDHLGLTYRYMGDYQKAVEAYETSLIINPFGQLPAQNLPIVYEYIGNYEKALFYYNKIKERYPENAEGFYGASRMHIFLKDYEQAADQIAKAYNLYIAQNSPYRADAETIMRVIYTEMNNLGQKERFFEILKQNNIDITE